MKSKYMETLKSLFTMIQHMYCLLVFRKMSFPIHFDFSLLAGIIIRLLFTTFYPCFFIIFLEKNNFFHVRYMVLHKMFLEILFEKKVFSIFQSLEAKWSKIWDIFTPHPDTPDTTSLIIFTPTPSL